MPIPNRIRFGVCSIGAIGLAGACAPILSALFGESVPVNVNDSTRASVQINVPDAYIRTPAGDFIVRGADAQARAEGQYVTFSVIGEDPEGVRFVQLNEIVITPWCAERPVSSGGRPPPPPSPRPAPAYGLRGDRIETSGADGTATTRIPLTRTVGVTLYVETTRCPSDRPIIHGAEVRLRGLAGNFGSLPPAETGEALIRIGYTGGGQFGGGAVIGGGGGSGSGGSSSCAGEGDACRVHPSECDGRGDDFMVDGRIVCRGGEPVCEASEGSDYCAICGGACGGCAGDSCVTDADCAPLGVCARSTTPGGPNHCNSLLAPEPSTGNPVCSYHSGMCWRPSELNDDEVRTFICRGE